MSEQMDASNNDTSPNSEVTTTSTLKLAIKTPKEKKDVAIDASSTVKQVIFHSEEDLFFNHFYLIS
jgi:hypothetical protein